ncbi:M56 family metallopeptidase [Perlabentimonas gracilis]|uniref:M56 family metallopeptidase n=1 Tax=Perlabentimonas gracilis TaxID=2715279 RepID=UPI001409272A|nr:M56 family metallopeptidase [Perlabentimonas gracilis]NHB69769.1 M48 family metalloprotease [Perlabentimonas gracilis]
MEPYLHYLLRVSVATALFYLFYHLLLRRSKDFIFNRLYLLGSLVLSVAIPLIDIPLTFLAVDTQAFLGDSTAQNQPSILSESTKIHSFSLPNILALVYLLGAAVLLVRFGLGYAKALSIKRKSILERQGDIQVYVSNSNIRAFTFFSRIVVGRNILENPAISMVLSHELVHAKEKHFIDVMISELLIVFQWFNPLAVLYRRAIRNNLEFRADDVVVRSSNPQKYQLALLSMLSNRITLPIFTELNSTNLKQRVIMMKTEKNQSLRIAKFALLPMYALAIILLSGKNYVAAHDSSTELQKVQVSNPLALDTPSIQSVDDLRHFMVRQIRYPKQAADAGRFGRVSLYLRIDHQGKVAQVMEAQPAEEFIEVDEILAVARLGSGVETLELKNHKELVAECKRVVSMLPELQIQEFMGKVIEIQVVFMLQK